MHRLVRLALLACVSLIGLAFTGSALAAYTPDFAVVHSVVKPAAAGGTTFHIKQDVNQNPTAHITIFAPAGYTATLGQAPGTQIGQASAKVSAPGAGPGVVLPLAGAVTVDDPAKYTTPATACTGSPTHTAVWLLSLSVAGQTLNVPVYIDQSPAIGTTLQTCFSSPATTPFQAKLLDATFTVTNIFSLPAAGGEYAWSALFTPYTADDGVANPVGTVETRGFVRSPAQLTLTTRVVDKRRRSVATSGKLSEFTFGIPGIRVTLFVNSQPLYIKTDSTGAYAGTLRLRGSGRYSFHTQAVVPERDYTSVGCSAPSKAPGGCVSATLGGYTITSPTVTLKL